MNPTKVTMSKTNRDGLIDLQEIIDSVEKLKTLTTIASFALVFSAGFSLGTVIDIYTNDWQLIANTAKSCGIITRGLCYNHCAFMYLETNDSFWEKMAQQFR
jgi:hypothetical protein